MKLRHPILVKLGGLLGATAIRGWMSTLDYRVAYYDPAVDPVHPDYAGQKLYVFWHEYILFPLVMRGHCNLAMLLSRHGDAEILSRTAYHLGFDCVRGSTRRGGVAALRALFAKSRHMNLTITPDGPKGPRRVLAPGPVFLASKLQLPLVLLGLGYDRPWRVNSWDRFALPRPGSRARAVVSPALHLPRDLDRKGLEHYRLEVERLLNRLTLEAEAWAEAGSHKVCEEPARREHRYSRRRHASRNSANDAILDAAVTPVVPGLVPGERFDELAPRQVA
ncbi:MAG TPA: lysophospholipid acyltransferase family protein [Pirellulales bacterium]|nr:lysophospholipid acyltransferase family protein [Pirellulales bacterium]